MSGTKPGVVSDPLQLHNNEISDLNGEESEEENSGATV